MTGQPTGDRPDPALLDLVRLPHVTGVVSALGERPLDLADLCRATGTPRRRTLAALHALAAYRAVDREPGGGSWDLTDEDADGDPVRYHLTPTGRALVAHLSRVDSRWDAFALYPPFE